MVELLLEEGRGGERPRSPARSSRSSARPPPAPRLFAWVCSKIRDWWRGAVTQRRAKAAQIREDIETIRPANERSGERHASRQGQHRPALAQHRPDLAPRPSAIRAPLARLLPPRGATILLPTASIGTKLARVEANRAGRATFHPRSIGSRAWLARARSSTSTSFAASWFPGTEIGLRVDQTLAQDTTGTMAMMQFEEFGVDRVQVETAVHYVDHNILQIDFKNPDDHRFLQAMAARYGAWFSRPGNGICHYVHCERFATPGKTLIGADSHTTQSGSCAMIAIGAGGLDVAVCMAGHPFELPCPKIVGVRLENDVAAAVDSGQGRHPRAAAPARRSRRPRRRSSSSGAPALRR